MLSSGEGVQVRQIGAGGRFIFEERMDGGRKLFLKLNYIVEPLRTTRTEWLVLHSEVPNLDCVHFSNYIFLQVKILYSNCESLINR